MKKKEKKAQFTVFVILGIVMLIMFFIILYAVNSISNLNAQREAREAVTSILDSASINYYVQSCLELVTTQAIDEIALQGGTLYKHQIDTQREANESGKTHVIANITFEKTSIKTNASYSIRKTNECDIIAKDVPNYPRPNTYLANLYKTYESKHSCSANRTSLQDNSGFFGLNQLTRLCTYGSENLETKEGQSYSPCYLNWIRINSDEPKSIEELLRRRVLQLLPTCIDFNLIQELQGSNIYVEEQQPELEIILNRRSLSVKVTYPFTAQLNTGDTTSLRHEFGYASPLRITQLHNYVMSLLATDTKDIQFNLTSTNHQKNYTLKNINNNNDPKIFPNVKSYYHPDFEVEIKNVDCSINEDCENNYDHDRILIVKDKASSIQGRPLTFVTTIQNRYPALDYINDFPEQGYPFNMLVQVGEEIIIDPQGYDPDDRELTYNYTGWKQTHDKICNPHSSTGWLCEPRTPISSGSGFLTNSQMYQETKRKANYTTNATDIGLHDVIVSVCDIAGLCDSQVIKILVLDVPKTNINTKSPYVHQIIPDNVTSIEDPITIQGKVDHGANNYGVKQINYTWIITNETGQSQTIQIPEQTDNETEITIPNSTLPKTNMIQIIKDLFANQTGKYEVLLKAKIQYENPDIIVESTPQELEINIKACIPVHNNILSYPYNTNDDPFMANHTCCGGTITDVDSYELLGVTQPCYTETFYGELNTLRTKAQQELRNASLENYTNRGQLNINPLNLPGQSNDVFKMTLTRYCDGERGNICAGDLNATLEVNTTCHKNLTWAEQCTGPLLDISSSQIGCTTYNYPQTFETANNLPLATGQCITTSACSTIGQTGYGVTGGRYWCSGAYCNNGDCTYTRERDCACVIDSCGARCNSTITHLWQGNVCYYGCIDCDFSSSRDIKCQLNQETCYNNNYCYTNVICDATGGEFTQQEYCERGQVFNAEITTPELSDPTDVSVCLHGSQLQENQRCNSTGNCQYQRTFYTCETTQTPICHATQGALCRTNTETFLSPTTVYQDVTVI